MKMKLIAGVVASLALLSAVPASAQQKTVRIGAIYPLSGALASTGAEIKAAVELAVEIVNNPHPELEGIPLAAGSGLPALAGPRSKWCSATPRASRKSGWPTPSA